MTEVKNFLKSKTIWLNLILGLCALFNEDLFNAIGLNAETGMALIAKVAVGGNFLLRFATSGEITIGGVLDLFKKK